MLVIPNKYLNKCIFKIKSLIINYFHFNAIIKYFFINIVMYIYDNYKHFGGLILRLY